MNRRRALAAGGLLVLALLAGCSAAGSLALESATDDTVAEEASRPVPDRDEGPGDTGAVVRAAIENGSATARSQEPPVEAGLPFRSEGRYYNVSWSVVDRQPGTAYRLGIDYNGTAQDSATVAYGDLSARDRAMLDTVLPPVPVTTRPGSDYHFDATYNASEREESVLLDNDTEAVRYEGETYPVTVKDTEPTTVLTRRYTATVVASSTDAYAGHLRSEYAFALSDLSDAERSVVTEAINDTYYADSDSDEGFRSVLERFHRHEAVEKNEYRGIWIVRYDGRLYLAELSYEGFDVERA
ncbi:hypothetical protein [Haloarcula brevis]|uniref:hypothetical protein n=1 Tax=Haloarcula brevis TaxID=3111453 RepID=UPI00300E933B